MKKMSVVLGLLLAVLVMGCGIYESDGFDYKQLSSIERGIDVYKRQAWGVALGAVGGAGVCAGFPYLPQLLSGSGGLEASQDDGCSHVQLSDTGGDYRCFPHLRCV